MARTEYILVIRLSAMGDVALTVPVLRGLNPGNKKIAVLTRPVFEKFFSGIDNIEICTVDLEGRHRGLVGLFRLAKDISRTYNVVSVIDLHSVMRSWVLGFLLSVRGSVVYRIKKGRREKKAFIKTHTAGDLPHTTQRYRDVFIKAGIETVGLIIPSFHPGEDAENEAGVLMQEVTGPGALAIGISPFAMHSTKSWDTGKTLALMKLLDREKDVFFFLFGGREEAGRLEELFRELKNIYIVAGRHSLSTELALISRLGFMVSMDSANMHLAALSGTRTVSIWGATHPAMGFA
ncbi:MAG TPA: glycosyltransferase family 9 protein, partial [Bacteroidales bacterium]|nr:glycosyltransferase family 9 protein [Bacteroidales bacterium]